MSKRPTSSGSASAASSDAAGSKATASEQHLQTEGEISSWGNNKPKEDLFVALMKALDWTPETRIYMLMAYLDESGVHDKKTLRRYAFGGAVAQCDVWQELREAWCRRLNSAGIKWFHYKEWKSALQSPAKKSSQYFGWSNQQLIGFMNDLASIISRKEIHYLCTSVRKVQSKRAVRASYESAVKELMIKIDQKLRQIGERDQISFMSSTHAELAGIHIQNLFEKLKTIHPSHGYWLIGEPREEPGLQIADLIVYQMARSRNIRGSYGTTFKMPELTRIMQLLRQEPPFHHMVEDHQNDDFKDDTWAN